MRNESVLGIYGKYIEIFQELTKKLAKTKRLEIYLNFLREKREK